MRSARLITSPRPAVVLVAHGSRDPRAAASTEALARAVRRARPEWLVRAAYLDHAGPRPLEVLGSLGSRRAVLVPLLLTSAYHGRVDLPAVLASAADLPVEVTLAGVLGPVAEGPGRMSRLLVEALVRRLPMEGFDGVVLAAAGTRDPVARGTVEYAAAVLGARLGVPSRVSYSSGVGPRAGEAVRALRAAGSARVAVAGYFLAPGLLYDQAAASAWEAGAVAVAEPLGDAPELVGLIGERVAAAGVRRLAAA
ncbi:sirohydrochlorin chelatase [Actinoplanes ianthinogenes]|uniref:Sirohydrochlorin chelatase n=1 Tax=Actinoplanes ianthinogenes TaxID=122358 RepID=A0ABM7LTS5_9ACTN|nr:CbiX/SirB N-terminal domain-containing protein [Actinoplanes ianthinogenes]BCJ42740.1 sirohydrochlorin chelatase [Actinoplanes ianthinogenes]GGQ92539.1 sirohydrochlorin chelatase [Actinoplanes ianthinogenes]